MATLLVRPLCSSTRSCLTSRLSPRLAQLPRQWRRSFQASPPTVSGIPDYAFAFDIDGVLVRSANPIPGASETLRYLQQHRIPFILLTNGGGKSEAERVADLSAKLDVPLNPDLFVQSHTPFADLTHLHDATVLVVGGDADRCRHVANGYGFRNVVTPGDIVCAYPDIWPFATVYAEHYRQFAQPLPRGSDAGLKIDAIFVYNDSRDWGLDAAVMLDLLLSDSGILGTVSGKNGDRTLTNNGYLQDGQPPIYYSNPDLWWASAYPLSRLGQGGFIAAFDGLWASVTDGASLRKSTGGKPSQATFEFAEKRLRAHRKTLFGQVGLNDPLRKVYMIGDNPESDIRGANNYESQGSLWTSILVKTGVYKDGTEPSEQPHVITEDVQSAVEWAMEDAKKTA